MGRLMDAPDIGELLRTQYSGGSVVAGICGGTLALARAGLLNETPHTSNDVDFLQQNAEGYSGAELFCVSASAISDESSDHRRPELHRSVFTAAIFESIGLDKDTVKQFSAMLAAEHA